MIDSGWGLDVAAVIVGLLLVLVTANLVVQYLAAKDPRRYPRHGRPKWVPYRPGRSRKDKVGSIKGQ